MSLSPEQQQSVAAWARSGVSLSDIQKRIGAEFGITLTYRDVRFLVDDLQVDLPPPPPKPAEPAAKAPPAKAVAAEPPAKPKEKGGLFGFGRRKEEPAAPAVEEEPPAPAVRVEVDRVVKPGTLVSGNVTFSDGQRADWYMDQMGRLGLGGVGPGYRPPAEDIAEFQAQLQQELMRLGYA